MARSLISERRTRTLHSNFRRMDNSKQSIKATSLLWTLFLSQKSYWTFHGVFRGKKSKPNISRQAATPAPKPASKRTGQKYCVGTNGVQCCFGTDGKKAQPHGPKQCWFCDIERLNEAFHVGEASLALRKRFARLTPAAQQLALERVQRPGNRQWLQQTGTVAPVTKTPAAPRKRKPVEKAQSVANKRQKAETAWREVLQERTFY